MASKRNPIIDVDPFGPPLLNNIKKKAVLPNSPQLTGDHTLEYEDKQNNKQQEEDKISSRPKTAAKSRRPKSKSKSPKRVQISTDPKDLPTINSNYRNEINESEDVENSIYSNDSFIQEDVLNLLD